MVVNDFSFIDSQYDLIAPSVQIDKDASVGDVETSSLTNLGGKLLLQAPFPASMPPVPIALVSSPGSSAVNVDRWRVRKLAPGSYAALTVNGTLLLEPGTFSFATMTVGDGARVLVLPGGTADVRVAGALAVGKAVRLSPLEPEDGWQDVWGRNPHCSRQHASQLSISVFGYDGASSAAVVSSGVNIVALLCAPHGSLSIGEDARLTGAFAAFDLSVGDRAVVAYETGFAPAASSPGQRGSQQLSGYVTAQITSAPLVATVPQEAVIDLAIGLPLSDPAGLQTFIQSVSDPKSLQYRQYVSGPDDFATRFGPSSADYASLQAFVQGAGMTIAQTFANRLIVHVYGTAPIIESALHTTLSLRGRADGSLFYAPDIEPSLDFAVPVLRISGLDNYAISLPGVGGSAAGSNSGQFQGSDFRNAYLGKSSPFSALTGAGVSGGPPQHVGLFELDNFSINDLRAYENLAGLPQATVNLNSITYGFSFPNSLSLCNSGEPKGEQEISGDVEMVSAMAPGAQIDVYTGLNCAGAGQYNSLLSYMATTQPMANQLSTSWFTSSDGNTVSVAEEFAAQGQTFFVLSGDNGAYLGGTNALDIRIGVGWFATLVGGTSLTMTGAGRTYSSETTWNNGTSAASGGGIMAFQVPPGLVSELIPWWQSCPSSSTSGCSTQYRNSPDVSAVSNSLVVCWGAGLSSSQTSQCQGGFAGTSYSTPLWAAFTALINQQAQMNGDPPIGLINPALYSIAGTAAYGQAFNDIADGSNSNGYTAVPGYDLATGLGTPQWGLIYDLVGGPTPPPAPDAGASGATVSVGASETSFGPILCASGSGWTPGGEIELEYIGIPGRTAPLTGSATSVASDGTFSIPQDTSAENFYLGVMCSAAEVQGTVTVLVQELDSGGNVVGSTTGGAPAADWCLGVPVSTNFNGGCP